MAQSNLSENSYSEDGRPTNSVKYLLSPKRLAASLSLNGGPACAGPLGQIEPTIATVDDTAVPDRLSISCHLLAVQIGCSLSAQQVPLCLTLQRVSRPFLRVTFFKASWAGTADSRRRRRQYLFSDISLSPQCVQNAESHDQVVCLFVLLVPGCLLILPLPLLLQNPSILF